VHGHDPPTGRRALAGVGGDLRGPIAAGGGLLVTATPVTSSGGAQGRTVRALTRADRTPRWEIAAAVCTAPTIATDRVLVGTSDGILALALTTGDIAWQQTSRPVCSDLVATGDLVVGIEGVSTVVAASIGSGEERWRVGLPAPAAASPAAAGAEILVPLLDGRIIGLDAATGATTWEVRVPGIPASSPVITAGRIVVLLRDGSMVGVR